MLPHPTFPVTAKTRHLLRWAWYAAIVVVIVASVLPSDSRPMRALDALSISDKFEHLAAYAVLSFLPAIHERRRFLIAASIGAVALGVALEYVQLFSGWRDFEVGDMVADAAGVSLGLIAGLSLRSREMWRAVLQAIPDRSRGQDRTSDHPSAAAGKAQ